MLDIGIDVSTLTVFIPATIALIIAPGPDTVYVLTRSLQRGRRAGVAAAFGVAAGVLIHTTAAILGLSALLRTSALAYTLIKYLGVAYLLYLGIEILRDRERLTIDVQRGQTDPSAESSDSFVRGLLIDVLNPKIALFFLAFLPQFVDPGANATVQITGLGLVYMILGASYFTGVAVLSSTIRAVLSTHPRITDAIRWAAGVTIIGFSIELALSNRTPN